MRQEIQLIAIKGVLALVAGYVATAIVFHQPPRLAGSYTANSRADLTQFIHRYVAKAPGKRRSQWGG